MLKTLAVDAEPGLLPWLVPAAERRDNLRRRVARAAVIMVPGERTAIPCVVLDLCGSGARLGVHRDLTIPEQFLIAIDREGMAARCRIGWRRGNAMGVQFLEFLDAVPEHQ